MDNDNKFKLSKKQLIIIISAVAAVLIAAAVLTIILVNSGKSKSDDKQPETTSAVTASTSVTESTQTTTKALPDTPPTSEVPAATEEPETLPVIDINIPTEGGEVTHFDGVYVPNSNAEDVATGEKVSMRSLFGPSYSGGAVTFKSDGTFTDTLSMSGTQAGAYNAENHKINATYLPDRQMDITIIEWDGSSPKPFSFYIIYNLGGDANYKVYFSEKQ